MDMKIKEFIKPDTLMVLTSYPTPEKGKSGKRGLNAVGWHSERLIKELSKKRRVLVLAEKDGGKSETPVGKNTLVKRIWEKGSLRSFIRLARFMYAQKQIKSVLIQFEFNVFGGILPNLYLLALILLLRLSGKRVSFEFHQVILDIKLLQKHVNITNPLVQKFYNVSLRVYYFLVGLLVNNIIVFEVELKRRLKRYVADDKIYVLSLAVEKRPFMDQKQARILANAHIKKGYSKIKQNEFVILLFGFINGYKGIDWVIKQLKNSEHKNIRLLVVGGQNPYLSHKKSYQTFYNGIVTELKKHTHMSYVDFVREQDIPLFYNAADISAIPYEVFMAASGPFSHALSYKKPVILSEHLEEYTNSQDIKHAMKEAHIQNADFIFKYNKKALHSMITEIKTNPELYSKLSVFSSKLGKSRRMDKIALKLDNILFPAFYMVRQDSPALTKPSFA
ncbi:MAG: glycosyltransferase [Candidatus Levybacteria bacterium]|nr:glycosyltransferase [Candidatus Levybacteria bacterium]